jgi:hypothetical protein
MATQQTDLMSLKLWAAVLSLEQHPGVADLHIAVDNDEPTIAFVFRDADGRQHQVSRELWELETLATGALSVDELLAQLVAAPLPTA